MKKSAGDIVVLHMCTKKSKSCDVWFLRYGVRQTELFVIIDCFLPFYHPLDPENFSKIKKNTSRYYHFTNVYRNDSQMIYGFLDMECNRQIFLSFWTIFCPFTALTTWKMTILKNWKKNPWRYHHFTQVSQKSWSYAILFLRYGT